MILSKIMKKMIHDLFLQEAAKIKGAIYSAITQVFKKPKQLYVNSTIGSDSRYGSLQFPYKTIQHALNQAVAGDTVNVMNGRYYEQVEFKKSGTKSKPITLRNHPGHAPIIDGIGLKWGDGSSGALIQFNRHSNLIIEGLRIQNSSAFGIGDSNDFPGFLKNVKIRNCSTANTYGSGIYVNDAKNIEMENCTVTLACSNTWDECITLQNVNGFEVKDCHVYDGFKEGIDAKVGSRNGKIHGCTVRNVHSVGIYIDAYSGHQYDIEVFNNTISDMPGSGISTGAENGGKLENVLIRNNTIYSCDRGINIAAFNEEEGTPYVLQDIIVRNNVTFDVLNTGVFIPSKVENVLIENNILFTSDLSPGYGIHVYDLNLTDLSELTIRNNFFRVAGKSAEMPIGTDAKVLMELEGDSSAYETVFKDATGEITGTRDFTLADDSYARGAGYRGQDMGSHYESDEETSASASKTLLKKDKESPRALSFFSTMDTYNRGKIMSINGLAGIAEGIYFYIKQPDKKIVGITEVFWSLLDNMLLTILLPNIIALLLLSNKLKALLTKFLTSEQYRKIKQKIGKR